MKKILLLINDCKVPEIALSYAAELALKSEASLFGIFVHGSPSSKATHLQTPDQFADKSGEDSDKYSVMLSLGLEAFGNACADRQITCNTHVVTTNHLDTLIDYSAFADLIVCDADTPPLQFSLNSFLGDTHCPVLLINKDYAKTDVLVFTYDDKLSSIYAIRLFTYLFGFYKHLPVHFVSVVPNNVIGLEYGDLIREWLPLHYPNSKIEIIKGDTKDELKTYINQLSNPLVIMGAFGRNLLSRFFKESLANYIMTETNVPIFIAHN